SPKNNIWCGEHRAGYRSYCHPGNYKGQKTKLFHNNHDGTFTDVSDASGVGKPESKGMGVVLADFNNDGWTDIAIANDSWPNFLFLNNHEDRKSTRLNSSHQIISYAVFCLKRKYN